MVDPRERARGLGPRDRMDLSSSGEIMGKRILGFRASDLFAERFTHKNGTKAGQIGVSLKARLLRISWAKVEGQPFLIEQAA